MLPPNFMLIIARDAFFQALKIQFGTVFYNTYLNYQSSFLQHIFELSEQFFTRNRESGCFS